MEEPKKISCPSCTGIATKEGDNIVCEACDATFKITKTGGARVKDLGRLDDHEKRLDRLETLLPGEEPDPAKLEPSPVDLEPDPAKREPSPADSKPSILGPE